MDDDDGEYIVAEYVEKFVCKCGACRSCCCKGWPITLSYKEYCRLLGVQCGKNLRKRLDCAFFILPRATGERYAEVKPTWEGDCPLHDADGYCGLQKACGAEVLPEICKMYPRNVELPGLKESGCANSCEGVLELMFASDEKLSFVTKKLNVPNKRAVSSPLSALCCHIQKASVEILQDRTLRVAERLIALGEFNTMLLDHEGGQEEIKTSIAAFGREKDDFIRYFEGNKRRAFAILSEISDELTEFSPNYRKFAEAAKSAILAPDKDGLAEYARRSEEFFVKLPKAQIYFEHIAVNHVFFTEYPYSFGKESFWKEYEILATVIALTKFIAVGFVGEESPMDSFVDCVAGLFRCFEHSDAPSVILGLLGREGVDTLKDIASLLLL